MKPTPMPAVFLLFLVLLMLSATRATGIRLLKEESMSAVHNKVQEKSLAGGGGGGVAQECGPPGHCSGTSSRELMNTAKAEAESKRSNKTGVDNARGSQRHSKADVGSSREDIHVQPPPPASSPQQIYPDVMDIAGMDYSPANRKPPIHN